MTQRECLETEFLNLPRTILDAKNGDADALNKLLTHTQSRIRTKVFRKVSIGDVDDVTQDALLNIVEAFPKFRLYEEDGHAIGSYYAWIREITKTAIAAYYQQREKNREFSVPNLGNNDADKSNQDDQNRMPFPNERTVDIYPDEQEHPVVLEDVIRDRLTNILSQRELELVTMRMQGLMFKQLIRVSGLNKRQVIAALNQAREKIEGQYLYPAGFRKVSEYAQGDYTTLVSSAKWGSLRAVLYLGRWYTTDQWVSEYKYSTRKTIKLNKGTLRPTEGKKSKKIISYQSAQDILTQNLPDGFRQWFFTSAWVGSKDKIPYRKRKELFGETDDPQMYEHLCDDLLLWLEQKGIEFNPSYRKIFYLRICGKTPKEIGKEMNYSEDQIVEQIMQIRTIIEQQLFLPNGIMSAHLLPNGSRVRDAVRQGFAPGAFIFGRWYASK
jgi:DNA-directed RNA polymerase specialized sigma24 family protein